MVNILSLVGNTPVIEIPKDLHGTDSKIFAKLEFFNPTKSLKDRVAVAMIEDAEKSGKITKDTVIIEPTSGNMGIALAFVCSIKGYKLILTMPESMSQERKKMVKYLGAQLELTKKELGFKGAIDKAYELSKEINNSIVLNQYNNNSNFLVHYNITGQEIYEQTNGELDVLVAGTGTGAFISGASAYIKEKQDRKLHTICVEPEESNILRGGNEFSPHAIQGIGPNFVPGNFNKNYIDHIFPIKKEEAINTTRLLARKAGICGGISTGAAAFCAIDFAKKLHKKGENGQNILFIAPDFCERYVSTDLFED